MLTQEQEESLVGNGECFLHSHPVTVAIDQYHRMHQLEQTKFVTSNYTSTNDDIIFVDTTTGVVIVSLPTGASKQHVTIVRTAGANAVTVLPIVGETINLGATYSITTSFKPLRLKGIRGTGYLEI